LLKSIYIAAGWTFMGVFALMYYQRWPRTSDIIFICFLFVKLFIMTVVYDIKDLAQDSKEGTWTIPLYLGVKETNLLLHGLNLLATAGIFALIIDWGYNYYAIILVLLAIYQTIMIDLCKKGASEWVYFGMCDLEQFIWLLGLMSMRWMVQCGYI
jgi:4-hydroxybenzoate polyprenyltransferase